MSTPLSNDQQVFRLPAAQELLDARNEIERLRKLLERINLAACYASEENTDSRVETLLLIGRLARGEVMP